MIIGHHKRQVINKGQVLGQSIRWATDLKLLKVQNIVELRRRYSYPGNPRSDWFYVLKVQTSKGNRTIPLSYKEFQGALSLIKKHHDNHPEWMEIQEEVIS